MPPQRRRRRNLDENFSLPRDTDPDDVLRRLLGVPGPIESYEEVEDPDREGETEDS
jgi:hypothetical protein